MNRMVRLSDLPKQIQNDIRDFENDNRKGSGQDVLPLETALDYYLLWNGVLGYTNPILQIVSKSFKE
jgi:hypothetical protein